MSNLKLKVTPEKRYETIEKMFNFIEKEFEGIEITAAFTKDLLNDAMEVIDNRVLYVPLSAINNKLIDKE